jgi:hypothetical protein
VGKTSEREGVLLISSNLKITSAKIKPTAFTYLFPSISVLEINWKKPNTAFLDFCAKTAVPYGRTVRNFEKCAQKLTAAVRRPYSCTD